MMTYGDDRDLSGNVFYSMPGTSTVPSIGGSSHEV